MYATCINNANKNTYYGHMLVSVGYYWMVNRMQQYSLITDRIGESGGRTLMIGDQHHGSLSCTSCRCATPPLRISVGSKDDMPQLLLRSN